MSDTLNIYGHNYSTVAGFKAKNDNGDVLTYTRKSLVVTDTPNETGVQMDISLQNEIRLQGGKQVTISTSPSTVSPDTGYDAMTSVIATVGSDLDYLLKLNNNTLTSYNLGSATKIRIYLFNGSSALTSLSAPNITYIEREALSGTGLTMLVLPSIQYLGTDSYGSNRYAACGGMSSLTTLDCGSGLVKIHNYSFQNDSSLTTIIFRSTSVVNCGATTCFNGTPFANGGTGGTIYIPKSLYDHLGDGTSLDYKAATNWATYDGYGTITWAKIEGSQYETHYADGTSVPIT